MTETCPIARPGEDLDEHLRAVAMLARRFGGPWGELAGLWHDLGKYSADFQTYIQGAAQQGLRARGSVIHSSAGAIHAWRRMHDADRGSKKHQAICAAILSHHGSLHDRNRYEERMGFLQNALAQAEANHLYESALAGSPSSEILEWPLPTAGDMVKSSHFTRHIFSALVDADRSVAAKRLPKTYPSMFELDKRLTAAMNARAATPHGPIDGLRERARHECLASAVQQPGLFSLDAPTGFGKTLSSLAFAIAHANEHKLERVIYVAPYLSAMEQTAKAYRDALGDDDGSMVLEHHSNWDRDRLHVDDEALSAHPETSKNKQIDQRDNWDAPIIITSNVQFLESLHAHDAGRCRKLHRIAKSVVLIDEPQTIPIGFMAPIAKTLADITTNFGTSIVMVTATQPAFERSDAFPFGFDGNTVRALLSDQLRSEMQCTAQRRVRVVLPNWNSEVSWATIAGRMAASNCACMVIVNTKADARNLFRQVATLTEAPVFHLSAAMCVAHREIVLGQIMGLLAVGASVKVVATQVVETSIDIDFPYVMRASAGLGSLVQAAGRCNRHGLRSEPGVFEIFVPDQKIPEIFKHGEGIARMLLKQPGKELLKPETIQEFSRRLVREQETDTKNIIKSQRSNNYATVGRDFKLIENTATIVVPFDTHAVEIINDLDAAANGNVRPRLFERVQRYSVSVPTSQATLLLARKAIRKIELGDQTIYAAHEHAHDPSVGLLGADDIALPIAGGIAA